MAKPDPVRLKSQPLFASLSEDECEPLIFGLQFREMEAQLPEIAERIRGAMEERLARA